MINLISTDITDFKVNGLESIESMIANLLISIQVSLNYSIILQVAMKTSLKKIAAIITI